MHDRLFERVAFPSSRLATRSITYRQPSGLQAPAKGRRAAISESEMPWEHPTHSVPPKGRSFRPLSPDAGRVFPFLVGLEGYEPPTSILAGLRSITELQAGTYREVRGQHVHFLLGNGVMHPTWLSLAGTCPIYARRSACHSGRPFPPDLPKRPCLRARTGLDYLLSIPTGRLVWHGPRHHPLVFTDPSSHP